MKATIVTTFMLSPLAPVTISGSSADFRNSLLSRVIRGNQMRRCSIIFVNFYNFVNPWAVLKEAILVDLV
jgi:hypothetical protein